MYYYYIIYDTYILYFIIKIFIIIIADASVEHLHCAPVNGYEMPELQRPINAKITNKIQTLVAITGIS